MIDRKDLDSCVLLILKGANPGKGERPKGLTAYQIVDRLPQHLREALIKQGGIGGKGGGMSTGLSAAQECQHSAMRLARQGLVEYTHVDAGRISFTVKDENGHDKLVDAGYPVTTFYVYAGPWYSKGWHVVKIENDVVTSVHSDVLNGAGVTVSIGGATPTPLASLQDQRKRLDMPDFIKRLDGVFVDNKPVKDAALLPPTYKHPAVVP